MLWYKWLSHIFDWIFHGIFARLMCCWSKRRVRFDLQIVIRTLSLFLWRLCTDPKAICSHDKLILLRLRTSTTFMSVLKFLTLISRFWNWVSFLLSWGLFLAWWHFHFHVSVATHCSRPRIMFCFSRCNDFRNHFTLKIYWSWALSEIHWSSFNR